MHKERERGESNIYIDLFILFLSEEMRVQTGQ